MAQLSGRLGRSLTTSITTGTAGASQATTKVGTQTYQLRICPTTAIWATVTSTAGSATANSDTLFPANVVDYVTCSPGQVFAFLSTSTSTGYVSITEMY